MMETTHNSAGRVSGKKNPGELKTRATPINEPLTYFLLLFAITVPFWIFGGERLPIPIKLPVSALAAFNPAIAALILVHRQSGFDGLKEFLRKAWDYRRIKNKTWYLPILFLIPLISVLSYAVMRFTGWPLPDPIRIPILMAPVFFVVFFIFAIGEELGWMGYAFGPLQNRWGALKASLLLGFIWALIHLVPDWQNGQTIDWILWHRLGAILLRIVMVWIYNNTGKSVFSSILFHASTNLSWALFPNYGSHYSPFVMSLFLALTVLIVVIGWGSSFRTRTAVRTAGSGEVESGARKSTSQREFDESRPRPNGLP